VPSPKELKSCSLNSWNGCREFPAAVGLFSLGTTVFFLKRAARALPNEILDEEKKRRHKIQSPTTVIDMLKYSVPS
jgi:hypothetical protein